MKRDSEVASLNKIAERIPRDSVGCWQVSIFVDCLLEVTKLPKVAEIILDRAKGKPSKRQCWMMASEYICGLLIASYEAA